MEDANNQPTGARLKRFRRRLAGLAGFLGLIGGQIAPQVQTAGAQSTDYRVSQEAPHAWREFANRVRTSLQVRLTADDDATRKLYQLLDDRKANGRSMQNAVTRVWVTPSGDIERLEFGGIDSNVALILREIFARERVSIPPPPDMLQPVHLNLSFRPGG